MPCRTPNSNSDRYSDRFDITLLPTSVIEVCQRLNQSGAQAYLVGGCVRDLMLGTSPKDFDIEVYNINMETLHKLLRSIGHVEHVGKQFGVFKLWYQHHEMDIALPRTERKIDEGHRGFDVSPDPYIKPEIASLRRDFTINAMMYDPLQHQCYDFHNGAEDLKQGMLRHVSAAFAEDPLRVLRGMQFAARFKLTMHPKTAELCQALLSEAKTLPASRIWIEWQKWCHSEHPSYGLKVLQQSGWLKIYPELEDLIGCPQDATWHPEGDVWTHTLLVTDQAAKIATERDLDSATREYLMFAALCHDLGKPLTTCTDENNRVRSPNHSAAGFEPTRSFLSAIAAPKQIAQYVHTLVHDHITHLCGQPTPRAIRRLADRLTPASIELWEMLVESDASGRPPLPPARPAQAWLKKAIALQHHKERATPIITGKMFIELGISPGPELGDRLKQAYQAQLDGEFSDIHGAKNWLSKCINK